MLFSVNIHPGKTGAKFKTIFLGKSLPSSKKSSQLIKWFRAFDEIGLAPEYKIGSSGNLSFRHKGGFFIKSTRTYFRSIKEEELVYVKSFDFDKKIAYVYGKLEPSTELQMHHLIYKNKKSINAIFHLHDYKIMEKAKKYKIPITKVTRAGTEKIGLDVLRVMDGKMFVIMKDHGVVAAGSTIDNAGKAVLKYHRFALDL